MKEIFLWLTCLLSSIHGFSQVIFEKGYYLDNAGQRIEGLIQQENWRYNPNGFVFKTSSEGEPQNMSIEEVSAFGLDQSVKFIRRSVNWDQSSDELAELSTSSEPSFVKKTLFLKVLVDGEASLFTFKDRKVERFFYQKGPMAEVDPLIYKRYKNLENNVFQNNQFRRQLLIELPCEGIGFQTIEDIRYQREDLMRFFETYNVCQDRPYEVYREKEVEYAFSFNIRPGLSFPSLSTTDAVSEARDATFDRSAAFRIGGELELAFSKEAKKWAIFIEPTFNSYRNETEAVWPFSSSVENTTVTIEYQFLEVPVGVRRYLSVGENSKLFINGALIFDKPFESFISFRRGDEFLINGFLDIQTSLNFAGGLGYSYQDKVAIEFRYHSPRNLLNTSSNTRADYLAYALIVGYRLFSLVSN